MDALDIFALSGAMIIGTIILGIIILIPLYIITSLANKRVLKYFNHDKLWAAWIPYYSTVCLAECMDEDAEGNIKIISSFNIQKSVFRFYPLLLLALNWFIPSNLVFIVTILSVALNSLLYSYLLRQESKKEETALAVISALVPIVWLVIAFTRFKGTYEKEIVVESSEVNNSSEL